MRTLLDNSVFILGAIGLLFFAYSEYRRFLQKTGNTPVTFRSLVQGELKKTGSGLMTILIISPFIALVISMVSFRELFVFDVFHTTFVTLLLNSPVRGILRKLTTK